MPEHTYTIEPQSKAANAMRNIFRVDIWSDGEKYGKLVATLYRDYRDSAESTGKHYCAMLDRLSYHAEPQPARNTTWPANERPQPYATKEA